MINSGQGVAVGIRDCTVEDGKIDVVGGLIGCNGSG